MVLTRNHRPPELKMEEPTCNNSVPAELQSNKSNCNNALENWNYFYVEYFQNITIANVLHNNNEVLFSE